ncbi:FixH family protein [Mesorhizobium sp. BAC0120]|uniref:FixH family protein n=1 Tax=Mesorhizobium sp. BAC0120 TaxID=3090670 RepID=UPI00298D545F|nr:FixH family protein [Mesorhizobium sp. BAC0120]MDW6020383.1 FixH family protein [Mesorhizobium sp. BAC0120]
MKIVSDRMDLTLAELSPASLSKRSISLGIIAFALLTLAAVWFVAPSAPPPVLDLSRSKPSEKGLYTVSIEPEGGQVRQGELQSWLVTLTSKAGTPVENARMTVDGGMPEHHHGLPTSPAMTATLGPGKYRVEGVKFHMGGWWQLRFAISAAAGDDEAVFNIKL